MSREFGVSDVTIASRIKQLTENKTILGFTAVVDQEKVGLPVSAFIAIRITAGAVDTVKASLVRKEWIEGIYEMYGFCDLLLKVRAKSLEELRDLVVKEIGPIREVSSKEVMTVLKTDREGYWNFFSSTELISKEQLTRESIAGKL